MTAGRGTIRSPKSRRLIAEAIDATLVVEAAAGTGKTTELVNRILRVIENGRADVREIVAVTFTEKAAGELKLRLRQRLEERRRAAADADVAARLEDAVQNLEEAHVSTIHGFCADLLRERPVEARVDPLFRVLTEGAGRAAVRRGVRRLVPGAARGSARRRAALAPARRPRVPAGEADEDGPIERLRRAGFELTQWRDSEAAWTREPSIARARDRAARSISCTRWRTSRHAPSYAGDNLFVDTEPVRRLSRDLRCDAAQSDDTRWPRSALDRAARGTATSSARRKGSGADVQQGGDPCAGPGRAQRLDGGARGLPGARRRRSGRAPPRRAAGMRARRTRRSKAREGALDFLDLLLRAREPGSRRRRRCGGTSSTASRASSWTSSRTPIRCRRSCCCCSSSADPARRAGSMSRRCPASSSSSAIRSSRSIVSGAPTWALYQRVCDRLVAAGAIRLELRKSFRSVPNIQRVVNAAFEPVMDGDSETMQARYMALEPSRSDRSRPALGGRAARATSRTGTGIVAARQIESSLPDAVGAYVRLARPARAAGRSPSARGPRRGCRSRRGTSASCSAASSASARTSRGRTSRRSRHAASATCSSAAGPFTIARRSRRCVRR